MHIIEAHAPPVHSLNHQNIHSIQSNCDEYEKRQMTAFMHNNLSSGVSSRDVSTRTDGELIGKWNFVESWKAEAFLEAVERV